MDSLTAVASLASTCLVSINGLHTHAKTPGLGHIQALLLLCYTDNANACISYLFLVLSDRVGGESHRGPSRLWVMTVNVDNWTLVLT